MITYPPLISGKGFPLLSQNRQFQWFNNPTVIYPLVPASAATLLKSKGYDVLWKDAIAERMTYSGYVKYLSEEKPDIIAIETKTPVIKMHWTMINNLKKMLPKSRFVLMGDHPTAFPEESLKSCSGLDYVLTGGDFDFALLELSDYIGGKSKRMPKGIYYRKGRLIKNSGKFQLNHNLNDLPLIDRELTKVHLYNVEYNIKKRPFAYTMVGRDCPYHKCKFCAWPILFPAFRTRSPESLLDEIGMLIEKYNVKEVFDDTGTFPPGVWLKKFCKGMIERNYNRKITLSCNMRVDYITEETAKMMKDAGFRLLKIGLESGNQKTLDNINKGIKVEQITKACEIAKKHGLEIHLTMIVGYPWETKKDAMKTLQLAKDLMSSGKADVLQSTVLVPYPGTSLWKEGLKNKWFKFNPYDYEKYDMRGTVFRTPDMTEEEVMTICNDIYKSFITPRYVIRRIIEIRSMSDVMYLLGGFKAVLGHMRDFSKRGC